MNRAAAVRIAVLGALTAVVALAVRALRGDPAPVFTSRGPFPAGTINPERPPQGSSSPTTLGSSDPGATGPTPATGDATELFPADTVEEGSAAPHDAAPDDSAETDDVTTAAAEAPPERPAPASGGAASTTSDTSTSEPNPPGERWVFPVDGECPESHPIKAKLRSGLYHLPGMMAYDRAKPDRCYATEVDAEADGLRRAKR